MTGRLANKIAVITGSSSGIGRATAIAFAREGASVVCSDIREEARGDVPEQSNLTTLQEVQNLGQKGIFVTCDTTKTEDVENLIKKAVQEFGRLDIMVNNAGITAEAQYGSNAIWEYDERAFDKSLAVNVKGVFSGIKFAAAQMKTQEPHPNGDRGWIINLASVMGLNGIPNASGYVASKHAVMGLTKAAAHDCAPLRIHVNALCPGYTATSFLGDLLANDQIRSRLEALHPFRGLGKPEDIARAAVFLASEDAGWVTGIGLPVDGGYNSM